MRTPRRPRKTSPPTTPPTIAPTLGLEPPLLLLEPPLLLLELPPPTDGDANPGIVVLEAGRREDSVPVVSSARVTLKVFATFNEILAMALQSPVNKFYRDILIGPGWHLDTDWNFFSVTKQANGLAYAASRMVQDSHCDVDS